VPPPLPPTNSGAPIEDEGDDDDDEAANAAAIRHARDAILIGFVVDDLVFPPLPVVPFDPAILATSP
jgi:hypothetical protein